jgi:hypothetical protein
MSDRFLVFILAMVSWSIFFDFEEGLSVLLAAYLHPQPRLVPALI